MTRDELLKLMDDEHKAEAALFAYKNEAYATGQSDAISNFIKGGVVLDMDPAKYLMSLVTKHFLALAKCDESSKKLVKEYARDIRLYMLLLMALIEDSHE